MNSARIPNVKGAIGSDSANRRPPGRETSFLAGSGDIDIEPREVRDDGMARAYPVDFRERLLAAQRAGTPVGEIARFLQVRVRTIRRWQRQLRIEGSVAPKPLPGRALTIGRDEEADIRAQVPAYPDATISEHYARGNLASPPGRPGNHVSEPAAPPIPAQKKSDRQ